MNIDYACSSSQGTKSGLFKYHSLANAESWAPLNPPSFQPLVLASLAPLCSFPVIFPLGSSAICHSILPTFSGSLLCDWINISSGSSAIFLADKLEEDRKFPTSHRTKIGGRTTGQEGLLSRGPRCTLLPCHLFPCLTFSSYLSIYLCSYLSVQL